MSHKSVALPFKDLSSLFETLPELKANIEDGISCGEVSSVNVSELPFSSDYPPSDIPAPVNQEVVNQETASIPKAPKAP